MNATVRSLEGHPGRFLIVLPRSLVFSSKSALVDPRLCMLRERKDKQATLPHWAEMAWILNRGQNARKASVSEIGGKTRRVPQAART